MLEFAYLLDPLSIFLYTWTFLDSIIIEEDGCLKRVFVLYRNISIYFFPVVSVGMYVSSVVFYTIGNYLIFNDDRSYQINIDKAAVIC